MRWPMASHGNTATRRGSSPLFVCSSMKTLPAQLTGLLPPFNHHFKFPTVKKMMMEKDLILWFLILFLNNSVIRQRVQFQVPTIHHLIYSH